MNWLESEWFERLRLLVKITLAAALLYVGYTFYVRYRLAAVKLPEAPVVDLHDDLYVHPRKSYVSDFESAKRRLTGTPLWVKEGYRWTYEPGGPAVRAAGEDRPRRCRQTRRQRLSRVREKRQAGARCRRRA